jgi:GNAT superfamily N-acetyltransferase
VNVFVAESEGVIVSSATITIVPNVTRGARPYALIENVVTRGAHRRRGLGRAVLAAALAAAWDAGS